jgi:glycosyltransferase involved in cell wall biosynthesis
VGRRRLRGLAERFTALPTELDLGRGRWVFCSEWMRAHAGLSPDPGQAVVLTPGVEERYLTAPAPRARDWSWRLLYLGRVVEQKGVITAIEALAQLPAEATLAIVGSGDAAYRSALERRASALGVAARVTFAPPVDRDGTVSAYQAADVVLHPVRWGEPWGLVPLEAMAAGRPVVATGQGGSADFLDDGVNALLHAPGDAAGLATALARLAGDPELRSRLVAAGHRTAQTHTATAFNLAAVREIAVAAAAGGDQDCQKTIV